MTHTFETPDDITDKGEIEDLLREYLSWAVPLFNRRNNLAVDIEAALADATGSLAEYLPPNGCTILARGPGGIANAVGFFRQIRPDAVEIKRLFLRPEARGEGVGRALVLRLIAEAGRRGHSEIYLDTADFMTSAHVLYRSLGFRDIEGYPEAEHQIETSPHVIYMVLRLE